MNLYIEEAFLLDFEIQYNPEKASIGEQCLYKIFMQYTGINIFLDELSNIKDFNSRIYSIITDYNPNTKVIGPFESYFSNITELPNQSIILCSKQLSSKINIENLGGLCLSFNDYEDRIQTIIECCHEEFDLSDKNETFSWEKFKIFNLTPFKSIVIDDPYILINQNDQAIEKNLLPMLRSILSEKKNKINLTIFTREIINTDEKEKKVSEIEGVSKRYTYLSSRLTNLLGPLCIVKSNRFKHDYYQHDRYLYTAFGMVSIGKGFNLFPLKKGNSSVRLSTIFDKSTYRKMNSHYLNLKETTAKLEGEEDSDTFLKIYPSMKNFNLFLD